MIYNDISPKTECCANCRYYRQHYCYVAAERGFVEVYDGHCVYPRTKNRTPKDLCAHFNSASPDETHFRTDRPPMETIRYR